LVFLKHKNKKLKHGGSVLVLSTFKG
jgi:hypothetical protein